MLPVTDDRVSRLTYQGAPQTVAVIRRAVLDSQGHIATRQLAEAFCEQLDSKDYASEALACYYGVLGTTRYMRDPKTVEFLKAPYLVCQEILAGGRPSLDCDDLSALLAALVMATGGSARVVTVAFQHMHYRGERQYSHVFCQAGLPNGTWVTLDPVAAENTTAMLRRVVAAKVWPIRAS